MHTHEKAEQYLKKKYQKVNHYWYVGDKYMTVHFYRVIENDVPYLKMTLYESKTGNTKVYDLKEEEFVAKRKTKGATK